MVGKTKSALRLCARFLDVIVLVLYRCGLQTILVQMKETRTHAAAAAIIKALLKPVLLIINQPHSD